MSLVSIPFNFFSPKIITSLNGSPLSYAPPGGGNGLQTSLSYTVSPNERTFISFTLFPSFQYNPSDRFGNKLYTFPEFGFEGDQIQANGKVYVLGPNITNSPVYYTFEVIKNQSVVFSVNEQVSVGTSNTLSNFKFQINLSASIISYEI